MEATENLNDPAERRKSVKLKVRPDLQTYEQKYEGKTYHVVKDPVCLRYYRFNRQEHFVFGLFDGEHTLEQVRDRFEAEFPPQRLEYQDLEVFARQLVTAGLVQHEQQGAGRHLFERRAKQRRFKRFTAAVNILYLKIPVFDPDRILTWMYGYVSWVFTTWFMVASLLFILAAVVHVTLHFDTFNAKLPAYQEFFSLNSVLYMWISLGVVKIIHEFGHGLSCKGFGGESHEMGVLLMCLSPALYCNVTDAWTLSNKWQRIIISFAGIYVELMIAAAATFVWWYTPQYPVVNNIALCVMVLCSVSTVMFNANPLMKFDGYYMLADWIEVPNLREKSTKFLNNVFLSRALGVEVPPEAYMAPWRKWLFVAYAIGSWVYRWVVMFGILWFLADFLGPKLKVLSQMLALASLASMFVIPVYKIGKSIHQRGRLPDMKATRVYATAAVAAALTAAFFLVPLPVSRVRDTGLVVIDPSAAEAVALEEPARLVELAPGVRPGAWVSRGQALGVFQSDELDLELDRMTKYRDGQRQSSKLHEAAVSAARSEGNESAIKRHKIEAEQALLRASTAQFTLDRLTARWEASSKLRAPRDGVLVACPAPDERGKLFDRGFSDAPPVFSVGDPTKLIVRVAVSPPDFRLLSDDLAERGELAATVFVKGRTDREFRGTVRRLPAQNAATVPIQLTQRGGGPLAVKPGGDPNVLQPLAQVYLVDVELADPDAAIDPGQLAVVKVHAKWRSAAWWVGRTLANALDVGLY
ncbi:m50 family : Multidrug resistance efflux pump OS=Singulisphaera acidiphila (strain ATCC BAA-1392 / DSM 18658 / VKM B-2454 / MOB10) GN=Sinac_6853 PE=4 SV=1: Peptidase_M50 [Gemmataceae bacterium]|nr:m50 family : Multidrug resistance efflux pump OS=Singulisphaera acidiphila (strain ATCC BAA-1392 / DSM 18658 / VKM B-2454 / MOB10) GN=Sinac_6853 PE=4 SV=1: Peptidase_M50 [Gemmataceae bacterium]VTT97087.1 m50 family : Multidrug resistance efflux pump OS=Singulisphaera acidiphila (strain ATCC BAA-1392 / DSM 18658 / VKM B-2454 / MOB10) GN=Sinac_6853 PE=4 SV=1: Peptidase_M50 [Gemmataceae bacterium]